MSVFRKRRHPVFAIDQEACFVPSPYKCKWLIHAHSGREGHLRIIRTHVLGNERGKNDRYEKKNKNDAEELGAYGLSEDDEKNGEAKNDTNAN